MKETATCTTWVINLKTLLITWEFSIQEPLILSFCSINSQGHAGRHERALSAQCMSKSYRGSQTRMRRDTFILAKRDSLVQTYPCWPSLTLAQFLIFKVSSLGQRYLSTLMTAGKSKDIISRLKKLRLLKGQGSFWKLWKGTVWQSNNNEVTQKRTSRLCKE